MDAEKASPDNVNGFEVARMARLLGVSRSGYYDWARRAAAGRAWRRSDAAIRRPRSSPTSPSDHTYGSPRILADLREAGEQVSGKTVAKLMRHAGIVGISPRGFVPVTTQPGPDPQPIPDLVEAALRPGPAEPGVDLRHRAPRGVREPCGGGRTPRDACRSRRLKLEDGRLPWREGGGWSSPRQRRDVSVLPDGAGSASETGRRT